MPITLETASTLVTAARRLDRLRSTLGSFTEEYTEHRLRAVLRGGKARTEITARYLARCAREIERVVAKIAALEQALKNAEEVFK